MISNTLRCVRIAGTGSFLPNAPLTNDQLDDTLGRLTEAPQRVQTFVQNVGRRMLEGSGIQTRHFAVDPETRTLTHTLASLGEVAGRRALEMANIKPADIDLLLISSPSFDATTPPTSTFLQERLGIEQCAEMEVHSNCAGVGKCVQIAYDALRLGRYQRALVVYSQLSSVYLRACYFNQAQMSKTQAALRYILADGAGALVLEGVDDPRPSHELVGTFVESVGGQRPPGMTAGAGINDLVDARDPAREIFERGAHHLDQDFAAVNRDAGPLLLNGVERMLQQLSIPSHQIGHLIVSIPTRQLYDDNLERFCQRLSIPPEKLKFRARHVGYVGGASVLVHLDEMVRSGELESGQLAVVHSVESSKWMSAGFVARW